MTKIITVTDYTVHTMTDGEKLELEAEAMRNTEARIAARKAALQAGIEAELYTPTGMAQSFFLDLLMCLCFAAGLSCFVGALALWLA